MSQACPNSRRSRRMKEAHRFIGGLGAVQKAQSVKRAAGQIPDGFEVIPVVRFADSGSSSEPLPSSELLGCCHIVRLADE